MSILAVTVYAGSKKLVDMTANMLHQFQSCLEIDEKVRIIALNNNAEAEIPMGMVQWQAFTQENIGFGKGVNLLIQRELFDAPKIEGPHDVSHVLVLNNDLEFPNKNWLAELLKEREKSFVLSPCTDNTASESARNDRAHDLDARRAHQVSAFCWLVPVPVIKSLRKRFGFNLFDPDFFAYGEDDYTGAILRRYLDPRPFKVVPRSWVRHLKGKTGAEMKMKGGMPENLELLKRKLRSHGLK
jgi:hypothetical protein